MAHSPTSTAVSLGHTATFHCSGRGTYLYWYINDSTDVTEGITYTGDYNTNAPYTSCTSQDSYMTIVGDCGNNNTEIYCVIVGHTSDSNVTSSTAYLLIQGGWSLFHLTLNVNIHVDTPPTIDSLESVQTNNDSLMISWSITVPNDAYTLQLNIATDDEHSTSPHDHDVYGDSVYELYPANPCTTYYISLTLQVKLNAPCTAFESISTNYVTGMP